MAKKLLYKIKIEGLDKEIAALKELSDRTKQLKDEVKQLEVAGSQEAERRKIELNETQQQYRRLQNEVKNRKKAEQESVNTLEKMRAKLAAMNQQLERTEIGTKKFQELMQQSKKLKSDIDAADQATGRFQGNVGNYKNAIIDAFQQMGINVKHFTGALESTGRTFEVVTAATGRTSGALRVLRLALISTGIGAIVVALGSLVTYLTTVQKGIDAVNKLLVPLGNVMQRVFGIVQELGGGIAAILSGNFRQGWEEMRNAVSGVGDKLQQAWQEGQRLYDIMMQLRQVSLTMAAAEGRFNRIIAEQREILQDVNKSDAERLKAGKQAMLAAEQLKTLRLQEVDLQIEQLKLQQKQNDTGAEGLKELAALGAKRDQIEADHKNEMRRVQQAINTIVKKGSDDRAKALEEERKAQAAAYAENIANINAIMAAYGQLGNKSKAAAEAMAKVFRPEDEEEIPDIPAIITALGELQQEEIKLAQQTTDAIKGTYAERLAALVELTRRGLITEEQAAERKRQINAMIMDDSIAALRGVAKEGSSIGRALFLFEKLMAVRKAFMALQEGLAKTAGSAPFPANIPLMIGFAAQVAGLISAIKGVVAPEPPKFARGVIGLDGAGTETSDSINARLSKGESVMTAKATRVFAPVLAQMERSVGNTPNMQLGNRRFAGGYIPAAVDPMANADVIIRRTIEAVTAIPVVVSEQDISAVQARVRKIRTTGDL